MLSVPCHAIKKSVSENEALGKPKSAREEAVCVSESHHRASEDLKSI
jgi:hypothetical protein